MGKIKIFMGNLEINILRYAHHIILSAFTNTFPL
jgi:hypothetical protein